MEPTDPKLPAAPIVEITSRADLEALLLESEKPAIIDFWAPWCAPCLKMAPAFEEAARQMGDKVSFAKLNTDAYPELGRIFNVRSLPTVIAFIDDDIVDVRIGAASGGHLKAMAQRALDRQQGVGVIGRIKRMFGGGAASEG